MSPRDEIVWLDVDDAEDEVRRTLAAHPRTRYPVARGRLDNVIGIVQSKDLLARLCRGGPFDLAGAVRPAVRLRVLDTALHALEVFRVSPVHAALVVTAMGEVRGIVTLHDVLEAVTGPMPTEQTPADVGIVRRGDGTWSLDGMLPITQFKDLLHIPALPDEEAGYLTLNGFVLNYLGRVPKVAERFEWNGFRFEIADMDEQRVDRILVTPPTRSGEAAT